MSPASTDREILQLWYAARLYYDLMPDTISATELERTIGEWSLECARVQDFYEQSLFELSSHLDSCAIRLYSIDEKIESPRYLLYSDGWNDSKKAIDIFSRHNTHLIIHCVIRNIIAHHEEKGEKASSYTTLRAYYFGLTFREILDGINQVILAIAGEIEVEPFV